MKSKYWLIIFLLVFCISSVFGQDLKFVHYTTEEGLSNGQVWSILQDDLGFIWIGTADGLNKFDGLTFQKFKHNPEDSNTISDNNVFAIIQDKNGLIWMGTNYGLNRYNPVFNRFKRFIKTDGGHNTLLDNTIRCLEEDFEGNIWIGTDNNGLSMYNQQSEKFYHFYKSTASDSLPVKNINCIYEDKSGTLWVGTKKQGLYKYDRAEKRFINFLYKHHDPVYQSFKNDILCIYEDKDDRLWIGTKKGGLTLLDRQTSSLSDFTGYYDNKELQNKYWISSIIEDKYHQLWVATRGGLTSVDRKNENLNFLYTMDESNASGINSNRLTTMYLDNAGSLWIGNYGIGIDVVHHTKVNFRHFNKDENNAHTIQSNIVLAFEQDEYGNLLIGSYGGGLSLYDKRNGKMTHYSELHNGINKAILKIYLDRNGIIWLGTWGRGLQSFNRKTGKVNEFIHDKNDSLSISNNTVISIYDDKKGNLWLGTYNGLNRFDKRTQTFRVYNDQDGLPNNIVNYITGNDQDTLWMGTKGGGFCIFDLKTEKFDVFQFDKDDSTSISSNVVNYIHRDEKGYFWLSTEVGLNRYDPETNQFLRITEKDGIPNNKLWGILEDKSNNLWISSNNGICRYTPDYSDRTKGFFRNFNKSDGLQGNEFTQTGHYYDAVNNKMYFGGVNGYNSFFPDKIIENDFIPPVHLINFKKMDQEVRFRGDTTILYKKDIQVSWRENFIAFEFVGLDYTAPDKNLYSYKMEGLDNNWSTPSTRNYAAYPNIRDGSYIFRVKAANNEGVWNDKGVAVTVTVNPPFWRTKWFIALSIIVIILAILGYIRQRTRRLKEEKRILEETVEQRTIELRQKNEDITSSIQYAKRIQVAILPTFSSFQYEFPNSFILYKPKDIVSGDFFWFYKVGKKRLFAAADCTGHGVPGAFMSIIGNNLLERVVVQKKLLDPAEILEALDVGIVNALNQRGRRDDSFDGMDIALCAIDEDSNILEYAGAHRPLLHIVGREVTKIKPTKRSIGGAQKVTVNRFVTNKIEVNKGDIIYAFSDGYPDQMGGPKGRKFMMKNLQEELKNIHHIPINEQKDYLDETIEIWMNNYPTKYSQVDDIIVIGVQF